MKPTWPIFIFALGLAVNGARAADDWLDDLGDRLQFSSADGGVRARLSGSLALEGYTSSQPVSDLVFSDQKFLFNPRLSLFFDAQAGRRLYFFSQLRADRGFDPSDEKPEVRLDEYAVRLELWAPGRLNVQVGKFATVVGNWVARHDAWNNPFITAPLVYDNLTGLWAVRPPSSADTLLAWAHVRPANASAAVYADKGLRIPVAWGPVYAEGIAVTGTWRRFNYAVELKNTGLSAQPYEWKKADWSLGHPNLGARVGYQPNELWEFGLSASEGDFLNRAAASIVPLGLNRHDYRERVLAQDLRFAWHRWQIWAEAYAARFVIPRVAEASTFAYYVEAKYKLTPQLFVAARWNQQHFGPVQDSFGRDVAWGRQAWRLDLAPTYRFSAHSQLKLEYSLRHDDPSPEKYTREFAAQLMIRF